MTKIILITGATSGIGLATAKSLVQGGHCVYGTYRSDSDESILVENKVLPLKADMTDEASLKTAVQKIISEKGRIDVLFNNAGYGLFGPIEEVSIEAARKQFEVNLFGLARLTQLVLPHMRKQGEGVIINTSSMGGKIYTPLGAWYHATKYALEGWSDCLRLEVKQFGIKVVIVEPGGIQTQWGAIAADNIAAVTKQGPYAKMGNAVAMSLRKRYAADGSLSSPQVIADVIVGAVSARRPKTRYVAGAFARPLLLLRKFGGDRIFDWVALRSIE